LISPELCARIRRLHYAEHWTVGTIAKQLDLSKTTVNKHIAIERRRAA